MPPVPATYEQALDGLLAACPELGRTWLALADWMDEHDASGVGIYNIIGQLVLPSIVYLLGDQDYADLPRRDNDYSELPKPGTPAAEEFLRRLYGAIDEWAGSPNAEIHNAVYIEFVESGYSNLSVEDLLRYAGPRLRQMAAQSGSD